MEITWKHKSVKQLISEHGPYHGTNPVEIIKSLSRELVLKAFTKEWDGPPYDILSLAKMLGFEVLPNNSIVDARISPRPKGNFLIEYNPSQIPARINFSLAHEIGHTLFSDCADMVRHRSKEMEDSSWELEFLCNVAAAEILLPYARFSNDANQVPFSLEGLIQLSNRYKASLESVFIRFSEVVEKPCMVMIARFQDNGDLVLDYEIKSTHCKLNDVADGYVIPKSSKAYDCIKAGWTSHDLEEWDIFQGEKYRVFAIGLPAIRRQTQLRAGLLIVPQDYDETPVRGMYEVRGDATEPRKGEGNKIIAQVVNTSAGTGFGFGKAMAKKYPASKKALEQWKSQKGVFVLGETQLVHLTGDVHAFQMVAQQGIFPKYGEIPLKYDSLQKCLVDLAEAAKHLNATVHMPMIGAGQAKGNWDIIQGMIFQELIKKDIEVTVYILPGAKQEKQQLSIELQLD